MAIKLTPGYLAWIMDLNYGPEAGSGDFSLQQSTNLFIGVICVTPAVTKPNDVIILLPYVISHRMTIRIGGPR